MNMLAFNYSGVNWDAVRLATLRQHPICSDQLNNRHIENDVQVHWQRAARTDKGVSAVGQVVSLKMLTEPDGVVDRINSHLPPQLRVRPTSQDTLCS